MKSIVFWAALLAAPMSIASASLMDFKVDHQQTPLALESNQPVFSWHMSPDSPIQSQTAYAIEVKDEDGNRVWWSDKRKGSNSEAIGYQGGSLKPLTRYQWVVTVWGEDNKPVTGESWFETGFMSDTDKHFPGAEWIGGSDTDRALFANYQGVFQADFNIQLDEASGSDKAAFVLGGNDFRLMESEYNIQGVDNARDESFVAFELDISPLEINQSATLNIFRVGYTKSDTAKKPLTVLEIPQRLLSQSNKYESHSVNIRSEFGLLTIYFNGKVAENLITPNDPSAPPYVPQGLNINPLAFDDSRQPQGNPADFITFPMLADIGFWVKKGQVARFSGVDIKNLRNPENTLFSAGSEKSDPYTELFSGDDTDAPIKGDKFKGYTVSAEQKDTLILKNPSRLSTPMLRTEFSLKDKPIKKAKLYATARGVYELYLNGKRVGEDYFTPGLTQYNKHHAYQVYDVANMLSGGGLNALGAWLGEGWWSGNSTYTANHWNFFGDRQSVMTKLVVTYADGSTQELGSRPDTWKVFHEGPVRAGSFFQGEIYDARLETAVSGWAKPGFDDSHWAPAEPVKLEGVAFLAESNSNPDSKEVITDYDTLNLQAQLGAPPKIVKTLTAQSVDEVSPGVFVYDMGQNMVGFPQLTLADTQNGQRIVMRYAEVKYPDLSEHSGLAGQIMMENIRGALAHDIYIAKGGETTIQPRFTFHGYRFLEITGIESALPLNAVKGQVVSSIDQLTAHYETSNEKVNQLWSNITWSMRSNFLSIPTDTPARNERMGWSGDINVFSKTATYMADVSPFLTRHMTAMRDLQGSSGRFTDVAPMGGGFGGTLWGSAGIIVPWQMYRQYNDQTVLLKQYDAMQRYISFLSKKIDPKSNILVEGPLGDWLSPEGMKNDNTLIWEAYHVHLLNIMTEVATLLGHSEDAAHYQDRAGERKAFFNKTYVDSATGKTVHSGMVSGFFANPAEVGQINSELKGRAVDTQVSYAVPIAFDVFDESTMKKAKQRLADAVLRENIDDSGNARPVCSLMTGFIGTASLMEALSDSGRYDLAYCLLQQESYPSWLYSVVNGATTIWERLNSYTKEDGFGGNNSMNSFNHYSFGSVGEWMIGDSLGIKRAPDSAGFKRFILQPTPDPSGVMKWAKGYYQSPYGKIESQWRVENNQTNYEITVPKNTTAELRIVATEIADIDIRSSSEGKAYKQEKMTDGGRFIYQLLPGGYQIRVTR